MLFGTDEIGRFDRRGDRPVAPTFMDIRGRIFLSVRKRDETSSPAAPTTAACAGREAAGGDGCIHGRGARVVDLAVGQAVGVAEAPSFRCRSTMVLPPACAISAPMVPSYRNSYQ